MKSCFLLALAAFAAVSVLADDITPHVGIVQVFGLRKISSKKIETVLQVKPGDPLPSRDETDQRLAKVSGVIASSMQAVCCDGRNMVLYIGIEEKNAPHFEYHTELSGPETLLQTIRDKYNDIMDATAASLRGHNADEDLTNGYSLLADPEGRQMQQDLIPMVAANLKQINDVLRNSGNAEDRAAAAYVLQYAPRTPREEKIMSDALQYGLQDPDEDVRKNAIKAFEAVLVGARLHREQHLHVEPTWFVELMNSLDWSDRRNASLALVTLTDKRDPDTLALIRDRALASVIDMARWQDLEHALPGFILAGRIAGLDESAIHQAWDSGNRESVLKPLEKHRGQTPE